ncbi:MAG TPA: hypothetical protein V6C69_07705 [Trichormus sp.]
MSLAQDPTFSLLQKYFVVGYRDITNEPYCGVSNRHEFGEPAVDTTNGAGPRNLQIFMLASDGTVLNCLPGYWHSEDIAPEMNLAARLDKVWMNPKLTIGQKDALFSQMQLAHIKQHSAAMVARSKMQGFDMWEEAHKRLETTDTISNRELAQAIVSGSAPRTDLAKAFKTTDEIFHERLAQRPFVAYTNFDVAAYTDYGKQKYDKNENMMAQRDSMGAWVRPTPVKQQEIGSPEALAKEHPNRVMEQQRAQERMQREQMRMAQFGRYQSPNQSGVWGSGGTWGNGGR